jgi:hypothetical protein
MTTAPAKATTPAPDTQPSDTMSLGCAPPVAEILQPGDLEKHAASLKDEQLLAHLKTAFSAVRDTLRHNLPYLLEARNRFAKPGQRLPVEGKPTWTQWVRENLHVDIRTVQRWLAAPKMKALPPKKEKQLRPVTPLEDWPDAMRKANDFVAAVKRLQAKTPVKGADMLIPALQELAAIAGCRLVEPTHTPEPKLEPTVGKVEAPKTAKPGSRKKTKPEDMNDQVQDPEKAEREARRRADEARRKAELAKDTDALAAEQGWGVNGRGQSVYNGADEP